MLGTENTNNPPPPPLHPPIPNTPAHPTPHRPPHPPHPHPPSTPLHTKHQKNPTPQNPPQTTPPPIFKHLFFFPFFPRDLGKIPLWMCTLFPCSLHVLPSLKSFELNSGAFFSFFQSPLPPLLVTTSRFSRSFCRTSQFFPSPAFLNEVVSLCPPKISRIPSCLLSRLPFSVSPFLSIRVVLFPSSSPPSKLRCPYFLSTELTGVIFELP